jgi:hypothetical protein
MVELVEPGPAVIGGGGFWPRGGAGVCRTALTSVRQSLWLRCTPATSVSSVTAAEGIAAEIVKNLGNDEPMMIRARELARREQLMGMIAR